MGKTYIIDIPERCGICDIYDAAAVAVGKNTKGLGYDCRHIRVSKDIFDAFCAYMDSVGRSNSIGMDWLVYGPKVSDDLAKTTVEIEEGFFSAIPT